AKEDPAVKKYQAMKRKPQTEAQARKNMMLHLMNVASFKMDYFKGMSYDDIHDDVYTEATPLARKEDENKALQKLNETPAEREAKRRKLDEDVEELKRHIQIVPNEDDDVYTEATPLARKIWKTQRNVHGPAKVKGWKILELCGVQIITFTSTQLILLVERKFHFLKEQVENGVVELYFVNTKYQLADIFTKALGKERIEFLINKLGMRSFTPETLKQLVDEAEE
nr:ribonuclease H [Tanacetum cinerariifolium]